MTRADCTAFDRYIGVDYSGAKTPTSGLPGLRVYVATQTSLPGEVELVGGQGSHWTRKGIAEWLVERLREDRRTLVGIDHGFSFPIQFFEEHRLPLDWPAFLDDFQAHWPTDGNDVPVDLVRFGSVGDAKTRMGDATWRRLAERRAGAKSVFHFDVPGSVAKSTHSGLPWLRFLRLQLADRVHFWPFDGWEVPAGRSVIVEVYPSLWSHGYPREDRTADQHDAYSVARWMRDADRDGRLPDFFHPVLNPPDRKIADIEGWILGVM